MAEYSKIEWTHHSANLVWGCTKVHEGCNNCYAESLAHRYGVNVWGNDAPRKAIKSFWKDLAKYQRTAKQAGEMHRVFVGSMMDIFEKPMPVVDSKGNSLTDNGVVLNSDDLRQSFFSKISAGEYPNLLFLLLTKRPSNINKYIPSAWKTNPPDNVMFGTSPVNQATFDTMVKQLLQVKGKLFLSIEPQLGPITLRNLPGINGIDWVIQGGESGSNRRPFDLSWATALASECAQLNIPYFFKQIDKVTPVPQELLIRQEPKYFSIGVG